MDPIDDIARQNLEASDRELERENDEDFPNNSSATSTGFRYEPEQEVEPSEEDIALDSLSREAYADYRVIRNAIAFSDLSERLVDMAVKAGLKARNV